MLTVADAVLALLTLAGVRRYYTVPGESYLELLDAVERDERLRLVSTRHESGAAFMAEADSRISGVPAVALGSRGPGASNLAIGVHTAHYDATPLVVLLGQVESGLLGKGAFQEVDLTTFFTPVTKWATTPGTAAEVPGLVAHGVEVATSGRPGPVAVAVPADFWGAAFESEMPQPAPRTVAEPEAAGLRELAARLAAASRPVAVVGGGAIRARAEVVEVAQRFGLGVYTAFRRQDTFPCDHPNYLGHLTIGTARHLLGPLDEADLVLLIGTRLDEVTSQGYRYPRPGCAVVRVGEDTSRADVRAGRETAATLRGLLAHTDLVHTDGPTERDWSAAHQAAAHHVTIPPEPDPAAGVDAVRVIAAFQRGLPDDVVVTNDAGNFSAFLHRYWRFTGATTQLGPAVGAMGYAVPAAVGAKLAEPRRSVLAVAGDGGVLMTGQELETAARYGVKIIVLVFQNGLYGTIAMHQANRFGSMPGSDIGTVDLVAWARGLGATGLAVTEEQQLDGVVAVALEAVGPVLVSVRTDPDIISPTARLSELAEPSVGGSDVRKGR